MNKQAIISERFNWQLVLVICSAFINDPAAAQAKLVMNGGVVTITNGASMVIDNADNTAITYNGTGYIKTDGVIGGIVWAIGPGNGNTYLLPFGNSSGYFPLQFNAAGGTGAAGRLIVNTYATPTWKNSDYLPAGVTNVNRGTNDNSAKVIDRFWQISPQGYTVNPSLTNLIFSYTQQEYAAPNTITETNLIAQRWNSAALAWGDYLPVSLVNTANNTVTVPAVAGSQLYNWWTLVDLNATLPVTLTRFGASAGNGIVYTSWQTVLEQNSDYFEIWRSKDGLQFDYAGRVKAAGTSTSILNYALTDTHPYTGTSYYKLKTVDKDGRFSWSAVVSVKMADATVSFLYPNPATNYITLNSSTATVNRKPVARLYDARGSLLQTFTVTSVYQQVNIAALAAGAYQISIRYNNQIQTLRFIKK